MPAAKLKTQRPKESPSSGSRPAPTLYLHNLVIDGEHYPEVHLPYTLHQLLTAAAAGAEIAGKPAAAGAEIAGKPAAAGAEIAGKPADADHFPPAPRTRGQIIKDAGLEENPTQLQALQNLYKELGPEGLAKAAETISTLTTQERTRFLNTTPDH